MSIKMKKTKASENKKPVPTPNSELYPHKSLLWWTVKGMVHYELLQNGRTITVCV